MIFNLILKDGSEGEINLDMEYLKHNDRLIGGYLDLIVKDQWWNRLGRYLWPKSKSFRKKLIEL